MWKQTHTHKLKAYLILPISQLISEFLTQHWGAQRPENRDVGLCRVGEDTYFTHTHTHKTHTKHTLCLLSNVSDRLKDLFGCQSFAGLHWGRTHPVNLHNLWPLSSRRDDHYDIWSVSFKRDLKWLDFSMYRSILLANHFKNKLFISSGRVPSKAFGISDSF